MDLTLGLLYAQLSQLQGRILTLLASSFLARHTRNHKRSTHSFKHFTQSGRLAQSRNYLIATTYNAFLSSGGSSVETAARIRHAMEPKRNMTTLIAVYRKFELGTLRSICQRLIKAQLQLPKAGPFATEPRRKNQFIAAPAKAQLRRCRLYCSARRLLRASGKGRQRRQKRCTAEGREAPRALDMSSHARALENVIPARTRP